tara:strand:- start:1811 stop:2263 length:453 start_codon:yes stop_codon:yes gene_type:complete
MELKKIILIYSLFFLSMVQANIVEPSENLTPEDVVKIQLLALQKNNQQDLGIKQTWAFAHPENKKFTGPYERFKLMIYGEQYKYLLNHDSHKITSIVNSYNKQIFKIEILDKSKQLFFYEWHVMKGSTEKCKKCWFTSSVSQPIDQGNTI